MKFLNEPIKNENDQFFLDDYIKSIENEYNADFVLNKKKESLEKEVRLNLAIEIKKNTKKWVKGEVYGRVKK